MITQLIALTRYCLMTNINHEKLDPCTGRSDNERFIARPVVQLVLANSSVKDILTTGLDPSIVSWNVSCFVTRWLTLEWSSVAWLYFARHTRQIHAEKHCNCRKIVSGCKKRDFAWKKGFVHWFWWFVLFSGVFLQELEADRHSLKRRLDAIEGEYEGRISELQSDLSHVQKELRQKRCLLEEVHEDRTRLVAELSEQNQRLTSQLKEVKHWEKKSRKHSRLKS